MTPYRKATKEGVKSEPQKCKTELIECVVRFSFDFFFNLSSPLIFPFPSLPFPSWVVRIQVTLTSFCTSHWRRLLESSRNIWFQKRKASESSKLRKLTIMHKQNDWFALVLPHSYTIICCPTTVEKDVSMRYSVCLLPRNKHFVTNRGNSNRHGVIRTTT